DRHRHPGGGRGPGGRQPDGDQRQPHHLAHLPHRRRDGGRRRRAVRRPVRPHQSVHGFHSGTQGVHGGGAGWHRQYSRRDGGRPRAGAAGGVRRLLPVAAHRRRLRGRVQGHLRVLGPHPDPDLPAQGPARRSRAGARVIHAVASIALLIVSGAMVAVFPRSILAFLVFQGSLVAIYVARIPAWLRTLLLGTALLVMMPVIGAWNGYYLEVATQVGIFVALALGLNIVVGLAGLLDLGYVAFFAVGAYTWAIVGSPHGNVVFGGGFPLSPWAFYLFLVVGLLVAAGTGILLGLPVLRLRGDYLAIVTLGFGEVIRVLANNLDKPINLTNGPKGI